MIDHDVHKWIIAAETGNGGYDHWQIRMRNNLSFAEMKEKFKTAHIEEASDNYEYERKDGRYYTSDDTADVLRTRFAELTVRQNRILSMVNKTNDREICVIVDTKGNTGKSFLTKFLYEQGKAFYVPPTITTPQSIIQFVASGYGGEPIVVIDIPRSTRWNNGLYICIETIKDGLIYDGRYHTTIRNVFGVRILVFCNSAPNVDKLSKDRWKTYDQDGYPIKVCKPRRKKAAALSDP